MRRRLGRLRNRARGSKADLARTDRAGATAADRRIIEAALPYTMTGVPRLQALIDAVRYCERRRIPGAFAECGVWRGGSVLAMIGVLQELGADHRDIYLYDTFEGMTEPTELDTSPIDGSAAEAWAASKSDAAHPWRAVFFDPSLVNEDAVRETVLASGYPARRVHFVPGPVERTLPAAAPESLALLRLDTDWYESTRHELSHLYPRLAPGGVLIVDDYGHWDGCRKAVDEYFERSAEPLLLARIDYAGRIAVKH